MTVGRFAGTFAGLWLLAALSLDQLELAVGIFTVVAAGAALVAPPFCPNNQAHSASACSRALPKPPRASAAHLSPCSTSTPRHRCCGQRSPSASSSGRSCRLSC
ncbi:hypothetical protein [Ensifer sp. 4252]|uniref:hypothetical protein n=1 Tax=Ensifer sp. 4252 TaxID=3373915 RepID=UPI003D1ADE72